MTVFAVRYKTNAESLFRTKATPPIIKSKEIFFMMQSTNLNPTAKRNRVKIPHLTVK